jgi:hypothetical protein
MTKRTLRTRWLALGMSHAYHWSRDSKALLVSGRGALPLRDVESLAYVYLPTEDTLYAVAACQ